MMRIGDALRHASRLVNRKLIAKAVNASVVFPTADKLKTDKVLHEIQVNSYNSQDIKMVLDKDMDRLMQLYAVGAKNDIFEACAIIDEISKFAPIDGIRFIQIHKTGVDLIRIHKTGNEKMQRAAFLGMNEFKRNLLEEMNRRTSLLLITGMALSFMFAGAKLDSLFDKFC